MSTSYFNLKTPITSVQVDDLVSHVRVTLFDDEHVNIGVLTFNGQHRSAQEFIRNLGEGGAAAHSSAGPGGTVRYYRHQAFTTEILVSEYGETVRRQDLEKLIELTNRQGGVTPDQIRSPRDN